MARLSFKFRSIVGAAAVTGAACLMVACTAVPLDQPVRVPPRPSATAPAPVPQPPAAIEPAYTPAVATPVPALGGIVPPPVQAAPAQAAPAPMPSADALLEVNRIALLLPTRSPDFARAAEAVRNGVFAARDALMPSVEIVLVETDDSAADVRAGYQKAAQGAPAAIIGPLTRGAVQTVAATLEVLTPTIALNAIDSAGPPNLWMFALQIEGEAQQVARLAIADLRARDPGAKPTAVVLTSGARLHQRAAQAFSEAFGAGGGRVLASIDIASDRGAALQSRIASLAPALVFFAIDGVNASTVRPYLRDVPAYGTSQLNASSDRARAVDLEGVHLVDMPWLVQRDAPTVTRYARSEDIERYSADLARLYAMGIDAFRLALEVASGKNAFGFDGVTGALRVEQRRVERRALPAVFRDGAAVADGSL